MKNEDRRNMTAEERTDTELSVDELEGVAGGRGGHHEPPHAARGDDTEIGKSTDERKNGFSV